MEQSFGDLIDSRYQLIGKIGSGGMGDVYHARDLLTGGEVALKRVTIGTGKLSFQTRNPGRDFRLALAQEFRLLASMRHPHIISVLDYGFDDEKHPFYTMDLLQSPETIVEYAQYLPRDARVGLLIQVAQALAYLHRRGVIHRDLKPDNVLVVNGTVKVVDFGLAIAVERGRNGQGGMIAGTLGYMAPELLMNEFPTERSDLYALGVIAYEVLVGEHPFHLDHPSQLMMEIIHHEPYMYDTDYDDDLGDVIVKLMAKNPGERYESANQVISTLAHSIHVPNLGDTELIRDSYIQAARFVGREEELARLTMALEKVVAPEGSKGKGSAWLIGGESGVGKSRLLDEIRAQAMVKGALVVRGQNEDGGVVFQMWRDIMRRLVLSTPLNEMELGVLREVVPDLESLVGREIPDMSQLRGRAAMQRLAMTIADVLRRQERAIVLFVEDLQWAEESLDVLEQVMDIVNEIPIMIVGTFRNEEMPQLPERVPSMKLITLDRLTDTEIETLSVSILGERVGKQRNLLQLLKRETEGNVFFLVEVVRVLAEEAGKLSHIGAITLPDHVFSGSMRTVIDRRLNRLPVEARPMLRIASVYGREIDLKVLKHIAPDVDYETWLLTCSNVAILEIIDGTWRFAHDRMRDGILESLDADVAPKIHRSVALAIEAVYPKDDSYPLPLMPHWAVAGNEEKVAQYAQIAARQAFVVSDYQESLDLLDRAAAILGRNAPAEIFTAQGDINYQLGNFNAARGSLRMALSRTMSDEERVIALAILGDIATESGQYYRAERVLLEALPLAEKNASQMALGRVLSSLGDVQLQQGRLDDAKTYLYRASTVAQEAHDINRQLYVMNRLGTIDTLLGNYADALDMLEQAYYIADNSNNSERLMYIINSLGTVARLEGDLQKAEEYYVRAVDIASKLDMRYQLPVYLVNQATVRVMFNQFDLAHTDLQEALDRAINLDALPIIFAVLVAYARLYKAEGHTVRAQQMLGLVMGHTAYTTDVIQREVEALLVEWNWHSTEIRAASNNLDFDAEVALLTIFDDVSDDLNI